MKKYANSKIQLSVTLGALLVTSVFTLQSCSSHSKLVDSHKAGQTNHLFRQVREPTAQEQQAGEKALSKWKNAGVAEKHKLADEIILGRTLLGFSQLEVISYLGKPDAFGATNLIGPEIELTGYNVANGESQCDLMISLKNGKVVETYLDVNF